MLNQLLAEAVQVEKVSEPVAAGSTLIYTDGVELTDGAEGVMFIIGLGTVTTAPTLHAEQSADNSSYADLEGSNVADIVDGDDDLLCVYDVKRSGADGDEWVRLAIDRTGGNVVIENAIAIVYGQKTNKPVTQGADVASTKLLHAPVEGTI